MLVSQQSVVILQGFTQDGRDACDLIDDKQHNPPRLVLHSSWILLLEVCNNSEPMLVKPGGNFNRVEPAGVANDRSLAPFFQI